MNDVKPKKILITFARSYLALELARQLTPSGHQIFVADTMDYHVCRFSNAVSKSFNVPSPRFNPEGYITALVQIVEKYQIDMIIPLFEEISYLTKAQDRFPKTCKIFSPSFDLYHSLHNKWTFQEKLKEIGIESLKTVLINHEDDLKKLKFTTPYALKACYSRASQTVRKVYPNQVVTDLKIEPHNPWIAQQWMEGDRYCTYSLCHNGKVHAHGSYPVRYAIDGNSCLIFEAVEHDPIFQWTSNLVKKTNYTGHIAFDFIESSDKKLYAIECNPRATAGLHLFRPKDRIDHALFARNEAPIFPKVGAKQQIATGMLLYGWKKSAIPNNTPFKFLKNLFSTKDVIFNLKDLKPFLFEPIIFGEIYAKSKKLGLPIPAFFTHDHDWNGENF